MKEVGLRKVTMRLKRVICYECGNKREPKRPVVRHADGTIDFVCPQCWKKFDYAEFMWPEMSADDKAEMRKLMR